MENRKWSLGVDVGGTFTDVVAFCQEEGMSATKVASTADQSDGVIAGIEKISRIVGKDPSDLLSNTSVVVHGTTVATNALLEYRGSKVGLLTTAGFRDELEFRRSYKESTFDPRLSQPHPICPRRYRIGITERMDHKGNVLIPLDEDEVRKAVGFFRDEGVDAVAISFLFSFVNPAHERRAAEIVAQELPDAFLSVSCDVLPEIREFERVSTTVVNAFVGPAVSSYIARLDSKLRKHAFDGELFIMQSNGGVLTASESAKLAGGTLLSGPAGGVIAGSYMGAKAGFNNLITVDMGGTSYDISVIQNLNPTVTTENWIARYRVAQPMLDTHTIGAGGGSIAWIDEGGAVRVGPESAGSNPGPVCYGRGGHRPTVTDVNLILGFLNPDYFLGGEMSLDLQAAERAVKEHIAKPLDLDVIEAAVAVADIVNNNMSNASHFVTTKRGFDPEDFALVAVGGAGAIHAGRQAELLGMSTVIVPSFGPVFCAFGDIVANLKVSEARTCLARIDDIDLNEVNHVFGEMERVARSRLATQSIATNFEARRALDLRYVGEVHEVTVPLRSRTKRVTQLNIDTTAADFHDVHHKLYAHKDLDQPIEMLTLRLDLIGVREPPKLKGAEFGPEDPIDALKGQRAVYFSTDPTITNIYDGARLQAGHLISGPAVIEQWGTTMVVYPGHEALFDAFNNCIIEVGRSTAQKDGA